ncbi:MAG: DNA polymerase III subunit delta' [Clostridia bacterium]|nr:DNA polymerase III subunit delta' [Clostridia bacterium]
MYGYEILHEEIAESLIKNVRERTVQHAYIFEGEEGVGSLECAGLFAQTLVCEKDDTAPCTVCNACIMAKAETHPDIYFIKPIPGKKNITVDQIRTVVTDAYTKPYESGRKVYIIAYGDDMNEQAQNAFLKVLEEPPQYAVFIILAENYESLLATIRSRCTRVRFNPVTNAKIREYVKKHFPDETEKLEFLVRYSGGVAGNVEKILGAENFIPLRATAFDKLESLLSNRFLDAYVIADFVEENKDDADLILKFWQEFVRDIMLIQSECRELVQNGDFIDRLINISNRVPEKRIVRTQEQLLLAQKMRRRYVSLHTLCLRLAFSIKKK